MSRSLPFQVEQKDSNVVTVRMEVTGPSWEQWILFRSDAHHDNTHCLQDLEKKHLDQAKARGAMAFDFGDLFCVMQGKWDPRSDMNQFRPELRRPDYLSAVIDYNSEFYRPYAENFVLVTRGNHEDSVLNRHHISLTESLARNLQSAGSPVKVGKVQGWVRFQLNMRTTVRQSFRLRYHHGYGGGGAVTKGTIQANRQVVFLDGLDFLINGHTHDSYHVTYRREYMTDHGRLLIKDVECLRCPGYKDEYSPAEGFSVLRGDGPKPQGAWWARLFVEDKTVQYELIRAK